MELSNKGAALIKTFEGYRSEAYPDPATGGEPYTIAWGHTRGVKPGDTCTREQADAWFNDDIRETVAGVNKLVATTLTQNQFDALVSFAYNCGLDIDADIIAEGLGDSTLLKCVNERNFSAASQEFVKWSKARVNGQLKTMNGLLRRREAERDLFMRVD